ncbi:hypothetical protein [Ramlibacter humi]|uniref:Two pore domain potassium channel family protein n=1 Tax=Ramlibacter humi TaxID=2530451 RepID=A0A4Z0BC25_9BURK|nr:hypothetical protein [Ramlibacter humi]TFY96181.1 hypothetical protein EZ216_20970 [Ramlibacter humi]
MRAVDVLELAAGVALAGLILRDVFDTVVVPGRAHGTLKLSRRLVLAALPWWRRIRSRGIGTSFAPAMLVLAFGGWMLLLVLAFGLMAHGLRDSFSPHLKGFGEALYIAGGAMATIGVGAPEPSGAAAAVLVAGGFCGLAVMTLAVTYLIEVQSNIAVRDQGVLALTSAAGQPPSALVILERYAELDIRDELAQVLRDGRRWGAAVLQSHVSHPSLVYFRSAGAGAGWPAALGTLVDLALILECLVDEPGTRGPAVLAREQAERLSDSIADLLGLLPAAADASPADFRELCGRLARAGYRLQASPDERRFVERRSEHAGRIAALSRHLGMTPAPLVREQRLQDPAG